MNKTPIITITDLRRNFGAITEKLTSFEKIILTRGGEPFAILKAAPEEKKKLLKKVKGAWKGTALDSDKLWESAVKKTSRKTDILL